MAVPVLPVQQQQQQQDQHRSTTASQHQAFKTPSPSSPSALFTFPHPPRPSNGVVIPSTTPALHISKASSYRSKWARHSFSEPSTILQLKPLLSASSSSKPYPSLPRSKQQQAAQKQYEQNQAIHRLATATPASPSARTRQSLTSTTDAMRTKRGRARSTTVSTGSPQLFFPASSTQLSSSPPSFLPFPTNTDTSTTSEVALDRINSLPPHLEHFSGTGVSRKRLERLRWLDPRYYGQGGPLADMDTLSRDGTSLSSPGGDEWELVENGPRKSIDQLWDEVYDYRRKLQQEQLALAQSLPAHASSSTASFLNMGAAGSHHVLDEYYERDDGFTPAFQNQPGSSTSSSHRPFQRAPQRRRNTLSSTSNMSHSYTPSSATPHHRHYSWSEYDAVAHGIRRENMFHDLPAVQEVRDDEDEEDDVGRDEEDDEYRVPILGDDDEIPIDDSLSGGPSGSAMAGLLLDDTMVSLEDYYSSLATSLTSLTSLDEQQMATFEPHHSSSPSSPTSLSFKDNRVVTPHTTTTSTTSYATSLPLPPSSTSSTSTIQPSSCTPSSFLPLPKFGVSVAQKSSSLSPSTILSPSSVPIASPGSSSSPIASPSAFSSEYAFYAALSSSLSTLSCTCGSLSSSSTPPSPTSPTTPVAFEARSAANAHDSSCPLHWQQTARLDPTNVFANKNRTRVEPGAALGLLRTYLVVAGEHKLMNGKNKSKAATFGGQRGKQQQHTKATKRLSLPFF